MFAGIYVLHVQLHQNSELALCSYNLFSFGKIKSQTNSTVVFGTPL